MRQDLPGKVDIAIIGGGIIGVMTALELAERGLSVALFEKGDIAGEQSGRNWGWVRKMGRDPREIPLMIQSIALWRGINERLGRETGFRQCGIAYLAQSAKQMAGHESWLKSAGEQPVGSRLINGAEVASLLPELVKPFAGALYTQDDARAEPSLAVPAIAATAIEKGVQIFTHCAVRGFETSAGKISHVVTERGAVACDGLVVAGGYWSRRFLMRHGISFPQLGVVNSVMRTSALDGPTLSASGAEFAFRKRSDGGYTLAHRRLSVADLTPDYFRQFWKFIPALREDPAGFRIRLGKRFIDEARLARRWKLDEVTPFEQVRVLSPEPVNAILDESLASLRAHLPIFENAQILQRWAGMIDVTPDTVPAIGPVLQQPGLYVASGFSGHGFGIGPGAAKLMADLITKTAPSVDPEPFCFDRFK
jgi:glycine/D-amino acid oxidase-like deaminating enzyme